MKTKQPKQRRAYYTRDDGTQGEIYVGKDIDDATFKRFCRHVKSLNDLKRHGTPITRREWNEIDNLPSSLRKSLAKHGLIEKTTEHVAPKLGDFIEEFRVSLSNKSLDDQTNYHYQRSFNYLLDYYKKDRRIDQITLGDAEKHCQWLMTERKRVLSPTTVFRHRTSFCTIFDYAVKNKYISANPYADVRAGKECNEKRKFHVYPDVIARILPFCPDDEFRYLLMLARFAGPRMPSEIREMKFEHYHGNRFDIIQGKTGARSVPFFSEIRPYFEIVLAQAKPGQEYVFEKYRKHSNVRKVLRDAIEAAGETPWPKLFNNLRASCITDKERLGWPETTMNMVFGNSRPIRVKNYVQKLREEEFSALCGIPVSHQVKSIQPAKIDYRRDVQDFEPYEFDDSDYWEMGESSSSNILKTGTNRQVFLEKKHHFVTV